MLCSANLHHRAKFRTGRSSRFRDMAVYWFFNMAAVRHLRFLKVRNFNCPYPLESQCVSSSQFSCRSAKPLPRYGRFSIFKMAAIRHLKFLKVRNFNCPLEDQNAPLCQILCRSVRPLRRYGRFSIFKMAAVRHLGFLKFRNYNCPYPSEVQNASSCQILCKTVKALRRYGRFRFFKMAAVRHLGFVVRLFGPPTKCILVVSVTVQNLVWIGSVVSIICKF